MSVFTQHIAAMVVPLKATFAQQVVMEIEDQAPFVCHGIFTAAAQTITLANSGLPISSSQPMLELVLDDLAQEPDEGDSVVIDGSRYTIIDCNPDGLGFLKLMLHKEG
ncbi:MAG TPA: hypothetical protein PLU46_00275 [Thiotrichales bacterium]|nr:hypothetical protein [Thiotrichales bacterium]